MLKDIPVLNALLRYVSEENAPFSMPGHKGGRGFMCTAEGRLLNDIVLKSDITEVEGMDNLHSPQGVLREAQELLAHHYGSKKSYFLVNGSTSGNLAMIYSSFSDGDKVLVERNCHRSIFNGIIMKKLNPIYIKNYMSKTYNAPISIDMEHFLQVVEEEKDIKGIVLTYPNYYGITCDLGLVIRVCKEKGIKVLIDCAHGAHFGITSLLPENPVKLGADMVVMSAHKTLPSLTQTAYLHVGESIDCNIVDFYVSSFSSTSPSYVFMATMDYARFFLDTHGKNAFEDTIVLVNEYKSKINSLNGFQVISQEDIQDEYEGFKGRLDNTRLVINVQNGYNAHVILDYLRSKRVQCEMSDGFNLVLIASPFNTKEDYEKLYEALSECPLQELTSNNIDILINNIPERRLLPWQVAKEKSKVIDINNSVGEVSAVNIVPYPPGVPLIMMGEIIDKDTVNMIQYYINSGVTVLGIEERKVRVVECYEMRVTNEGKVNNN